jgi:hypothetical protein
MTILSDKLSGKFISMEFREDSIVATYFKNDLSGISLLASSTFSFKDDESVPDELRDFIIQNGIDVSKVFVSIPDRWTITRFIDVPSMKGKGTSAIANLMRFEIERHIPFEIDEVAYDYFIMDERDSMYSMVFVAVQKGKIDFINGFLEKLSLKPDAITTSSLSVLNTIELNEIKVGGWQDILGIVRKSDMLGKKGETNISIYVEKGSASMAISRDGMCINLKSIILNSTKPLDESISEIRSYMTEMQSTIASGHFNRLIIAGNISAIGAGSSDDLKEMLGMDVEQVKTISGQLNGKDISHILPSVGACYSGLGLGTYTTNLLPHKVEFRINKIAPLVTKIFLALIFIMVIGIVVTDAVKQKNHLAMMEIAFAENEPKVQALEKKIVAIGRLEKRVKLLQEIKDNEFSLEILAELTGVIPDDSWISNLNFKGIKLKDKKKPGGELIINGFAASSSSLISLLEDSPFFEKVEFVGPIKKTKEKEQFKLSAKIVRPGSKQNVEEKKN